MMKSVSALACFLLLSAQLLNAQCGSLFTEGFESGSYTPTWSVGSAPITWAVTSTNPYTGTYSLEGTGGNSSHLNGLNATIASATPAEISWYIFPPNSAAAANYVLIGDNAITATNCVAFCYWQGGNNIRFVSSVTAVYNCTPASWYHVEMRNINWTAHTFDIYINNTLVYATFPFRGTTISSMTKIHLYNFGATTGTWDDIRVGGAPVAATSFQSAVTCNGGSNGSATASVSGGDGNYTYNWLPSGGNSATATGLIAGTYSCIVADGQGCLDTTAVVVSEPTAFSVATMQTDISCNGGNNGDAMVMVSGATPGYTYMWSPSGGTASTESNLTAGAYSCLITDANNCTTTQTFSITEPAALLSAAANGGSVCPNDTAMLIGTAMGGTMAYTYLWMPGNLSGSVVSDFPSGTTTYTLMVTDANGCSDTSTTTVNVYTTPVVSLGADVVSCASAMLDAQNAGSTFLWNEGSTTQIITVVTSGPYDVIVTDANGCTGMDTVNVTINANPVVVGSAAMTFLCTGEPTVQLFESPAGGTWSGAGIFGSTFEPDTAGVGTHNIVYSYTDSLGCSGVDTLTMTVDLCLGMNATAAIDMQVYPNPNNGQFEIVFGDAIGNATMTITDLQGRIVSAEQLNGINAGTRKSIDLSSNADGVYILTIVSGTQVSTGRITIQH